MERSIAAAQTIVQRIDEEALARRSRITRNLAADVLNEVESGGYGEEDGKG